jgi:hypothetical protein
MWTMWRREQSSDCTESHFDSSVVQTMFDRYTDGDTPALNVQSVGKKRSHTHKYIGHTFPYTIGLVYAIAETNSTDRNKI